MTYKTDARSNSYTRFFSACILTITLLCVTAFVCGTAGAVDVYVPEDGDQTIKQAVNNATAGAHTHIEARGGIA